MRKTKIAAAFSALLLIFITLSYAEEDKDKAAPKKEQPVETYESRHGFKVDYPEGWRLETQMEGYGSLEDADRDGGNYFAIMSYGQDDPRMEGFHYFPADTLKVEVWVFPNYKDTLAKMITNAKGVTRIDDFTIDGKKAKKVWQSVDEEAPEAGEIYSIYFVDDGKRVIFMCYPEYTSMTDKFEEIAASFRFK